MSAGTTARHHDVVVVGARCAGAATAMLLARRGLRVLVVDRTRYGSDTVSTHALMRGGVLQLHRWGVLDDVIASGTPPVRTTTFDYGTDRLVIPVKPAVGLDALYAPRRTVLDRILVDAAAAAGVTFRFGTTVTGLVRDRVGRVSGVVGRSAGGALVEERARVVVGADGVRSLVAEQVGAPTVREGRWASSVVYGYWSGLDVDGYEWYFADRSAAGFIPTGDGQVCAFAAGPAGPFSGGTAGRDRFLRDRLQRAAPSATARLAGADRRGALVAYTGRPGWLRRAGGPGWLLVGDAGAYRDPISAHGISDALRDAELAAAALADALGGTAHEREATVRFQAERDAIAGPILDVTDRMASFRWDTEEIQGLHLDLSTSLAAEVALLRTIHGDEPAAREPVP